MQADTQGHSTSRDTGISPYLLWFIWLFWLFFLAQPLSMLLALPASPRKALDLGGLLLFVALYLLTTWQNAWRLSHETPQRAAGSRWREWGPITALVVVGIALALLVGESALGSLIYVSAGLCGRLSGRLAAAAVIGLTALAASLGVVTDASESAIWQIIFIVPAVGIFVYFLDQAIRTNQELRRARQEIARLAVSEERLRFARDLHDLLGHTLSLIALKSELAGRLVSVEPERATAEIGDIETAARQALVEVREAVSAYRQPSLADELRGARELLTAAGVTFTQQGEPPPLCHSVEAVLAWVVREGVTNVIRHSQAQTCVMRFAQEGEQVTVEVRDDGAGQPLVAADGALASGSGLAGARERVVALGGAFTVGVVEDGGWRLAATLPLSALVEEASSTDATRSQKGRMTAWFG